MQIYCPSDTRSLLNNRDNVSNFALRYQYFLENEQDIHSGRVKFILDAPQLGGSQGMIAPLRDRQTNQLNYLQASGYRVSCHFYEVDWRMVIGLGGEHVQETNMTLDHVYGVPYLPGSAFKGIVRSWVIQESFNNNEDLAVRDIENNDPAELQKKKKNFFAVFGNQKSIGQVQFLPVYPTGNVTLSIDIMNPHFPNYYTGAAPPTDTQNPQPIKFLVLEQTPFRFILLSKRQDMLSIAAGWTDETLKSKGLGAKTASGYGYFGSQFNIPRTLRPDANFQIPQRTRPQRAPLITLDEALLQFDDSGSSNLDPQLIDMTELKNCATQLAQVATRDDYIELNQLEGIHPTLIESDEGYAMISEFGAWVWDNLKKYLLSARILELPRFIYSTAFRRKLKNLPLDALVDVQEELLTISNQLEKNNGDIKSVVVPDRFRYTSDHGNITFWE